MKKFLLLIILFSLAFGAQSNTIFVTTSLDNVNGSLRQCISAALNNDTIKFSNTIDSVFIGTQHIVIDKNITIIGNHTFKTIVSSDGNCRLFSVDAGKIFNVINLKLKKGYSLQPISANLIGGGAIWNRGITNITSCVFIDNVAYGEFAPKGAALYNVGTVNIENTEFKNNKSRKSVYSTGGEGGAICNEGGTVNARFCNFDNNFANSSGGAIANKTGNLNLWYCNFFKNTNFDYFQSTGYGGAVYSSGASKCKINLCNFIENKIYTQATSPSAGGIYSYGGAIYNDANSYMYISRSGFYKNTCGGYNSYKSTVSQGGVIFNKGRCYIDNSSFNQNSVTGQAGYNYALQVSGKDIHNTDYMKVESSSFFDNFTTRESIFNTDTLVIYNSITGANTVGPAYQADLVNTNKVISLGYNLFSRMYNSSFASIGDLFGTVASPLIAGVDTMGYYGAETLNLALTATSQCVNTGDPAISYTDQRNYQRDGIADKGANEFNGIKNCAFSLNSITVNHNTCFNDAHGSIQLNVLGSNYSLFWDNAMTSQSISNLKSGTYKFFLYDSLGCSVDSSIQINQPALLTSTLSASAICSGDSILIFSKYRKIAGLYTDTLTAINGCDSVLYKSLLLNPLPNITVGSTTNSLCLGSTATLTASGATSYTWSTNETTNDISVAPLSSSTFSVTGNDLNGCSATASVYITVNSLPTVSISTTQSSLCVGSSSSLNALGALTYTWNTTETTNSISVTPVDTTIYSVAGTDQNGCMDTAQVSLAVLPIPSIILSVGSATLCEGSTWSLSVSGANTYSWSTGAITPNIVISPNVTTTYTVTGTDLNNCSSTQTVSITVDNTCQDVWPGDANSDGVADNLDVLELGLHYTETGAPRANTSNNWQSYFANNWTGTITNGKNVNHSDCNGDGTINDNDTLAIFNNYGLTHAFKSNQQTVINPQISIVPDQAMVLRGNWGSASVYVGDGSTSLSNLNGIAFTVDFDQTLIEPNSVWLEYPSSFLNASNQNLHFRKLYFVNGKLYTATTHTINNDVSGNGLIAKLHYQIKSSLTTDQALNLGIVQAYKSDFSGAIVPLTSGTGSLMAVAATVGVQELNGSIVSISPNPTNGLLTVIAKSELQKIEVVSIAGQILLSEVPSDVSHTLNLDNFANGIYFVNVYQNGRIIKREKVVVNR